MIRKRDMEYLYYYASRDGNDCFLSQNRFTRYIGPELENIGFKWNVKRKVWSLGHHYHSGEAYLDKDELIQVKPRDNTCPYIHVLKSMIPVYQDKVKKAKLLNPLNRFSPTHPNRNRVILQDAEARYISSVVRKYERVLYSALIFIPKDLVKIIFSYFERQDATCWDDIVDADLCYNHAWWSTLPEGGICPNCHKRMKRDSDTRYWICTSCYSTESEKRNVF